MTTILDCSAIEQDLTDFAFDQLEHQAILEKNYSDQYVKLNSTIDPEEIRHKIFQSCVEKIADMISETKRGWDIGYSLENLQTIHNNLSKNQIKIE